MKTIATNIKRFTRAFSLVELLTVIAIIGILAALVMTVIPRVIRAAKVNKATMQMHQIVLAIQSFEFYLQPFSGFTCGTGGGQS